MNQMNTTIRIIIGNLIHIGILIIIVFSKSILLAQSFPSFDASLEINTTKTLFDIGDTSTVSIILKDQHYENNYGDTSKVEVFIPDMPGFLVEYKPEICSNENLLDTGVVFTLSKSEWDDSHDLLTIEMVSNEDIIFPFNQVNTAQVSLRVPSGELAYLDGNENSDNQNDAVILHDNGIWVNNGRFEVSDSTNSFYYHPYDTLGAHTNEANYDYLSFQLVNLGTRNIEFQKGKRLPLFSIKTSKSTSCNEALDIRLLDHIEDVAFLNNGVVTLENSINVLGAGGDMYYGNLTPCEGMSCAFDPYLTDPRIHSIAIHSLWQSTHMPSGLLLKLKTHRAQSTDLSIPLKLTAITKGSRANLIVNAWPEEGEMNPNNNVIVVPLSVED